MGMKPSSNILRRVVQRDPTGCGIACAAAISGLSYERVRTRAAILGIQVRDPQLWSSTQPMRILLAHLNIPTAPREMPFGDWCSLPDCALLAIKWHLEQGVPHWHWTVFVREGGEAYVLDPNKSLKSCRRTDFGRMRPKWFIEIFP